MRFLRERKPRKMMLPYGARIVIIRAKPCFVMPSPTELRPSCVMNVELHQLQSLLDVKKRLTRHMQAVSSRASLLMTERHLIPLVYPKQASRTPCMRNWLIEPSKCAV